MNSFLTAWAKMIETTIIYERRREINHQGLYVKVVPIDSHRNPSSADFPWFPSATREPNGPYLTQAGRVFRTAGVEADAGL